MYPPKFNTDRFTLDHYSNEHEECFIEMALDPICIKYMGGATGDEAEERALFQKIHKLYKSEGTRWFWIWAVTQNDTLAAHLELKETEHTHKDELEIVFMVHPEYRGIGLMTEVLLFLKDQQYKWKRRIIATVNPKNKASMALMEKWGIEKKEMIRDEEENYYKLTLY